MISAAVGGGQLDYQWQTPLSLSLCVEWRAIKAMSHTQQNNIIYLDCPALTHRNRGPDVSYLFGPCKRAI
jgi:hypothetical protein